MAPILYVAIHASSSVRSVLILAKALNIHLEEKFVDLFSGDHLKEEFLKINPQHTVPTLVEEDGYALWDSHAIATYLVAKYGKSDNLYPKEDIRRKSTIDQRLHFDSGVLYARGVLISKSILFENVTKVSQESIDTLKDAYGMLEKLLGDNDWVVGDSISVADICLGTTVTTWDVLVHITEDEFPKITAWIGRLQNLPYFKEANQPGLDEYRALISSKLNKE